MGLFDLFKKKESEVVKPPIVEQTNVNNDINSDEYIDDITFIKEMKHIQTGPWHQYDILFESQIYGWDFMIKWADYMSASDLENVSEVIIGEWSGYKSDITECFCKNEYKLSTLTEVANEHGMLSMAGKSKTLNAPTKIVWVNQTHALRLFTLIDNDLLIKKYAETVARWNFGTENAMKLGKPIPEGK